MLIINDLELLNGKKVNLKVHPGEVILIHGPNGVGKSLLLKTLSKLLPKKSGSISLEMKDSSEFRIDLWRSSILYLPSEVSFTEDHSVEEFLSEPFLLDLYKDFKSDFKPKDYVSELHARMNILSSGQRQRLAILRAMSLNATILLLDESFSHLDPSTREEILGLLKEWKNKNKIIFIVSHFEIETSQIETRIFNLE